MTDRNLRETWIERCETVETIKLRYDLEAAFDYAVADKL